jgi:glyoxylase-like metal-dependent hydrolase (beta-lactamase superfamily II)
MPDMTFTDELKIKVGKEKIKGYYFGAGHTNGDAVYHIEESDIVHVGDLMFNRRHPFIDRTAGASIANWTTVLDSIVKEFSKKTTYIFGHAGTGYEVTGNAADLMAFKNYLQSLLDFTAKEIAAGKTKEEILKATEIPGAPEWKGDGIQRPLTAAYEELTSK